MLKRHNPTGTDGFEFLEYCTNEPEILDKQFRQLGFRPVAQHKKFNIVRYQQGDINFLVNNEKQGFAANFTAQHGPAVCAMAFRVKNAKQALEYTVQQGAKPYQHSGSDYVLPYPAIYGVGGTLIYFIDQHQQGNTMYDTDFFPLQNTLDTTIGITYLDHVTHNVPVGEMDEWAHFYEKLFNFYEDRFFDIRGQHTGLISCAMASPCGKIRIPINEATEHESQVAEFIREFNGSGIQHIALGCRNIFESVEALRKNEICFLDVPDTYYETIRNRVPWHQEDEARLHKNFILLDGALTPDGGLLMQIFTENMLGPTFFEIIQRKGNQGFGDGNFTALFESIERDQIRRGTLVV